MLLFALFLVALFIAALFLAALFIAAVFLAASFLAALLLALYVLYLLIVIFATLVYLPGLGHFLHGQNVPLSVALIFIVFSHGSPTKPLLGLFCPKISKN